MLVTALQNLLEFSDGKRTLQWQLVSAENDGVGGEKGGK